MGEKIDYTIETVEPLGSWLTKKPFWEGYVWKICLNNSEILEHELDLCYKYLSEYLELIDPITEERPEVSFKEGFTYIPDTIGTYPNIRMIEVRDTEGINALTKTCSFEISPNLTLIYGMNGSGKSGIGRLFSNACFSRGQHELLQNIKIDPSEDSKPKATFVLKKDDGEVVLIPYVLGDINNDLKRFSVFDSKSVPIYLDESCTVNFSPPFVRVFDRVGNVMGKLEEMLLKEMSQKQVENPFSGMFTDNPNTPVALFVNKIDSNTSEEEYEHICNFDLQKDGAEYERLDKKIASLKAMDVNAEKSQISDECIALESLHLLMSGLVESLSENTRIEANRIMASIKEKEGIVKGVNLEIFREDNISSIGSVEWKTLITAAKKLYELEQKTSHKKEIDQCLLCRQNISDSSRELFRKYWLFLEEKAEEEILELKKKKSEILEKLKAVKAGHPKLLDADIGIRYLRSNKPVFMDKLIRKCNILEKMLDNWIIKIENDNVVDVYIGIDLDIQEFIDIIRLRRDDESKLNGVTNELAVLINDYTMLKHKKDVFSVKELGLKYLYFLKWSMKVKKVNFSGIKMSITKKRTHSHLVGVLDEYWDIFEKERKSLGCPYKLTMHASGEEGRTQKEFKIEYSEEYLPGQILSEGEQNTYALADFITETNINKRSLGIILDDPVTSLDHERKDKIAERLVVEAKTRQVMVMTHDIVFMGQLVTSAEDNAIPYVTHWMKKVNEEPGHVENNSSPMLASEKRLRKDSQEAIKSLTALDTKEHERVLSLAVDYLRSACEALVEELLFAKTIKRWADRVSIKNLYEVVLDGDIYKKIVVFHERLSANIPAHNRSDLKKDKPLQREMVIAFQEEYEELRNEVLKKRKEATDKRESDIKALKERSKGW